MSLAEFALARGRRIATAFRPACVVRFAHLASLFAIALGAVALWIAPAAATILEVRTVASLDDVEEDATGGMYVNSSDLELIHDATDQTVGMRWLGLAIPPGATITAAWIQFSAKETQSEVTNLTLRAQAVDNAPIFSTAARNVSSRPLTTALTTWVPVAWTAGQVGAGQRTPDLSAVVREVVNRPGWASGNALAMVVTGTGHRTAWAWDGNSAATPLLHVEYSTGPPPPDFPPVAALSVAPVANPSLTVNASGAGSTDTDLTPIARYRFEFGDGTSAVVTNAPTAATSHTYAAGGTYTVTLIVTDTALQPSTSVTADVSVTAPPPPPDLPPVAALAVTPVATPALSVSASGAGSKDTDLTPIATYSFDFGDSTPAIVTTAPTATTTHTYAAPGTYTVTLIATDTASQPSTPATASVTVSPDLPPVAVLTVTTLANPALSVSASGAGSTDTDLTPIASYRFDFGDGTPAVVTTAPTVSTNHTYVAAGSYTVTLTVSDAGAMSSAPVTRDITVTPPDLAPVARLAVTPTASPPMTMNASGAASTDTDATPIASYRFDFGDGTPPVVTNAPTVATTHTYAAGGTYTVTLLVTDTGLNVSAPVTAKVNVVSPLPPPVNVTLEKRVAASSDDSEERATGTPSLISVSLQLIHDRNDQTIGMRWAGLTIPRGATITAAWIQFAARESQSEITNLNFFAQAADNAPTFTTATNNVTSRARTSASANWVPVAWTAGEVGANQRTPDLSAAIQEVVNRAGWASGNALAIIVAGTGHRTAWSFDGLAASAPLLHIEYLSGGTPADQPPVARLAVTVTANPGLAVTASGAASTDTDATPIASYRFNFGDGTPAVVTAAPTSSTTHTYAAAGTYTVALIATDTALQPSVQVITSVTVVAPSPVAIYAGYYDTHHTDTTNPKPNPWQGSAGVTFVGVPDTPSGGWDSSALRIDNNSTKALTGVVVTADMGSSHFALWAAQTIPAGGKLILAQTAFQNFDGSDTNPAGCFGCDPSLCLTQIRATIPVVHVTIAGVPTDYFDVTQVLNTKGVDGAGCPATGVRNDESTQWKQIFSTTHVVPGVEAASTTTIEPPAVHALALAPPSPNPARGQLTLRFTTASAGLVQLAVYDVAGRVVRPCVNRELEAGTYQNVVDVRGVSPGVYFVGLRTLDGALNRMIVVTP